MLADFSNWSHTVVSKKKKKEDFIPNSIDKDWTLIDCTERERERERELGRSQRQRISYTQQNSSLEWIARDRDRDREGVEEFHTRISVCVT
jgi:hypothetical protein